MVESVKAASDVYAPISGEVVEVNDAIVRPSRRWSIPTPMARRWFFKLKIADKRELDGLMDEAAYNRRREWTEALPSSRHRRMDRSSPCGSDS